MNDCTAEGRKRRAKSKICAVAYNHGCVYLELMHLDGSFSFCKKPVAKITSNLLLTSVFRAVLRHSVKKDMTKWCKTLIQSTYLCIFIYEGERRKSGS